MTFPVALRALPVDRRPKPFSYDVVSVLVLLAITCSAMDVGFLLEGADSLRNPTSVTSLWRLWMIVAATAALASSEHPLKHLKALSPFMPFCCWAFISMFVNGVDLYVVKNLGSMFLGPIAAAALAGWLIENRSFGLLYRVLWIAFFTGVLAAFLLGELGYQPQLGQPQDDYNPCRFMGVGHPVPFIALCTALTCIILGRLRAAPTRKCFLLLAVLLIPCALASYRSVLGGIVLAIAITVVVCLNDTSGLVSGGTVEEREIGWKATISPKTAGAILLTVLTLGVLIAAPFISVKMFDAAGEVNFSGRLKVWPVFLSAGLSSPVFGLGPFGDIKLANGDAFFVGVGAAHSEYLQLLTCFGIPGALLWLGGAISTVNSLRRCQPRTTQEVAIRWAALASCAALGLAIATENILRAPGVLWMYLMCPFLWRAIAAKRYEDRRATARRKPSATDVHQQR